MEWCRAEKRRVDPSEDHGFLRGGEKRCFGGEAAPAGSDVISFGATVPENALIPNQTMSMQVAESASSTVHQFPATHFHTIPASCNNVDTLQQRPQHFQQFDSSSGAPMAIGGPHLVQVANTYMASSVMAMETDMLSRDALCRSSSVSSGTSTCESSAAQSPMVMDVLMQAGAAESGRKVDSTSSSVCRRCLAGEGGHFKHAILDRHEPHPWYF